MTFDEELLFDGLESFEQLSEDRIKMLKSNTQKAFSNLGVCSFSRTRKNQLMWAHYSDEHHGFCLGFDESMLMSSHKLMQSVKVEYQADLPTSTVMSQFRFDEFNHELIGHVNTEAFVDIIGTKYTSWNYEREQRLLMPNFQAVKFQHRALRSIAFGLRMSERDKQTIRQLLSSPEWEHLKWYQAKKVPKRFALEFEEIKNITIV